MLDLAVLGIPAHDLLLSALEPVRVGNAVQQVVPEFVREREVDPPLRCDRVVVDDTPALAAVPRLEQRAVEGRKVVALNADDRIVGKRCFEYSRAIMRNVDREIGRHRKRHSVHA